MKTMFKNALMLIGAAFVATLFACVDPDDREPVPTPEPTPEVETDFSSATRPSLPSIASLD